MITDKCPNGPKGPIGLNPKGPKGPIGLKGLNPLPINKC